MEGGAGCCRHGRIETFALEVLPDSLVDRTPIARPASLGGRSIPEKTALVSLSAGTSASIVLHGIEQSPKVPAPLAPEVQETIRAKRVEIVSDEGEVCVLLRGSQTGGVIQWQRPGRTVNGEQKPIFAHIGSHFPGFADFWFGDPTGDSTVGLSMSIGGMPQSGVLTMTGLNGKEVLRVDTWALRPTVTVNGSTMLQK